MIELTTTEGLLGMIAALLFWLAVQLTFAEREAHIIKT
jgi:hypothetical protein